MRSALLIATSLIAVLPPLSDAADYSLVAVPYHSQIAEGNPAVPNNWCSVACINMLFDYYEDVPGPPFCQVEIAMVVNTDDAAGSLAWQGTQASDARRGCHFSVLSQSINGGLFGYGWRSTGFSAVDTTWHWSVSTLKNLLDLGYPVIIHSVPGPLDSLYQQDGSPFTEATDTTETGHSRVLIGYNDTLAVPVFIMHDPWSPDSVPIGAFVWCTQSYFWNTVWPPGSGLLFAAPWEISVTHPDTLDMNDTVKVKAKVHYTGPPPLTGHFPLSETPVVRLVLPPGLSFSSGDSSLHRLSGINLSGDIDSTEWYILTGESASEDTFLLLARGILSSSSVSYPAGYRDSIGGYGVSPFVVADISPPVVDVIYPDGGELLHGGTADTIRWTAADNVNTDSITILLTIDGGLSWDTLASGEANDSSQAVSLPSVVSDSCLVEVLAFDSAPNTGSDTSDSFFAIWTDLFPPTVTVAYPNGGEVLLSGSEDSVRWVAYDSAGVDSVNIYLSTDNCASWETLATGEPNDSVSPVTWPLTDSDSCFVRVAAFDPGELEGSDTSDSSFEIHGVGTSEHFAVVQQRFGLWQNDPNPFRRETLVRYSLGAGRGEGRVLIYDSCGRLVKTLTCSPGGSCRASDFVWNGKDERGSMMPSGVYICQLRLDGRVKNVKMIMVR